MKRSLSFICCAIASSLVIGAPAYAVSIRFEPALVELVVGDTLTLDVIASDLASPGPPSIGTFDLTMSWNPAVLAFSSASFGSFLGAAPGDAVTITQVGSQQVRLVEISLLSIVDLEAQQGESGILATLRWIVEDAVASEIAITGLVGDAAGRRLGVSFAPAILTAAPAVPEPSGALLFACGLWIIGRRVQKRGT